MQVLFAIDRVMEAADSPVRHTRRQEHVIDRAGGLSTTPAVIVDRRIASIGRNKG